MFPSLICHGEKTSSLFFFFFNSFFFSSSSALLSLGCVGEISRCFSVLQKKDYRRFSAESTGLVRKMKEEKKGRSQTETEWRRAKTKESQSHCRAKMECNQLHETGDAIVSLKIQ